MRRIVYFLLFASMAILSGCAALKHNVKFEQPTEGPRARVRVVIPAKLSHYRGVRAFPNSDCVFDVNSPGNGNVVAAWYGFEANLTKQKLGMPETALSVKKDTNQAEIFVVARQPIVFRYRLPDMSVPMSAPVHGYYRVRIIPGCAVAVSFTPEAEADYELEFGDLTACSYDLFQLNALPEAAAPFRAKRIHMKQCKPARLPWFLK
ncbi:MAG: hypothetical protein LBD67_10355 [Candidatus Accumulibacter sp.]|jgi:hypothetical protein|nr:hypothetical protein [Accumulibacter sp.]